MFPAADDHVLAPSGDRAVPVVAHDREISAVHPALGVDDLLSLLLVAPVPQHHRVAADTQLAGLTPLDDVATARIDDLDFHMG